MHQHDQVNVWDIFQILKVYSTKVSLDQKVGSIGRSLDGYREPVDEVLPCSSLRHINLPKGRCGSKTRQHASVPSTVYHSKGLK